MQALQFQDNLMAMQGLQALASMNQCKQQSVLPLPAASGALGLNGIGALTGAQQMAAANLSSSAEAITLQQQLATAIEQNQRMLSLLVESMKPAGQVGVSSSLLANQALMDARSNSPSSQLPSLAHIGAKMEELEAVKDQGYLALASGISRDPSAEDHIPNPNADNDSVPAALRLLQSMSAGADMKKDDKKDAQVNQSRYWTDEEHQRFLEGVRLFGANNHKAIAAVVRTRNSAQVRSHSQKFFKKLETFDGQGLPSMTRKRKNLKSSSPSQPLSFVTH